MLEKNALSCLGATTNPAWKQQYIQTSRSRERAACGRACERASDRADVRAVVRSRRRSCGRARRRRRRKNKQNGAKTAQNGAKTMQNDAKTAENDLKIRFFTKNEVFYGISKQKLTLWLPQLRSGKSVALEFNSPLTRSYPDPGFSARRKNKLQALGKPKVSKSNCP